MRHFVRDHRSDQVVVVDAGDLWIKQHEAFTVRDRAGILHGSGFEIGNCD